MSEAHKQKLYCYVDETGQDTKGAMFLVVVVITAEDPDALRTALERIEQVSAKGARKWFKTNRERRVAYIREIVQSGLFTHDICFSAYENTLEYLNLTVLTTAKTILARAHDPYEATIFIDGLSKTERRIVADGLRKLRVKVRKVRGVKDEADALIRLADAIAGFVRDCHEGDQELQPLLTQALQAKIIEEIK